MDDRTLLCAIYRFRAICLRLFASLMTRFALAPILVIFLGLSSGSAWGELISSAQVTGIQVYDLGEGSVPHKMNNNGYVAGKDSSNQACVWLNGTKTVLGTLGGTQSEALDVNDDGTVVGWSYLSPGKKAAFKWTAAGGMVRLDSGSTAESVATAINGAGDVVGYRTGSGQYRSMVWYNSGSGGPLFGSLNTIPTGINKNRLIVGYRLGSDNNPNSGFYWNGLGNGQSWTTGYSDYYPFAGINDNGMTAGQDDLKEAANLLIGNSGPWPIGRLNPNDLASSAYGLNDLSTLIVGSSDNKALLFDTVDHNIYNMNDFLDPSSDFDLLKSFSDVNNFGQVCGIGDVNGSDHGFAGQAIIVPEPGTLALVTCGLSEAIPWCFKKVVKLVSGGADDENEK